MLTNAVFLNRRPRLHHVVPAAVAAQRVEPAHLRAAQAPDRDQADLRGGPARGRVKQGRGLLCSSMSYVYMLSTEYVETRARMEHRFVSTMLSGAKHPAGATRPRHTRDGPCPPGRGWMAPSPNVASEACEVWCKTGMLTDRHGVQPIWLGLEISPSFPAPRRHGFLSVGVVTGPPTGDPRQAQGPGWRGPGCGAGGSGGQSPRIQSHGPRLASFHFINREPSQYE